MLATRETRPLFIQHMSRKKMTFLKNNEFLQIFRVSFLKKKKNLFRKSQKKETIQNYIFHEQSGFLNRLDQSFQQKD